MPAFGYNSIPFIIVRWRRNHLCRPMPGQAAAAVPANMVLHRMLQVPPAQETLMPHLPPQIQARRVAVNLPQNYCVKRPNYGMKELHQV